MWSASQHCALKRFVLGPFSKGCMPMHTYLFHQQCSAKRTHFRKTCTKCPKIFRSRLRRSQTFVFTTVCATMCAQNHVFSLRHYRAFLKVLMLCAISFKAEALEGAFPWSLQKQYRQNFPLARACGTHICSIQLCYDTHRTQCVCENVMPERSEKGALSRTGCHTVAQTAFFWPS